MIKMGETIQVYSLLLILTEEMTSKASWENWATVGFLLISWAVNWSKRPADGSVVTGHERL